jgi:large subunit ribosomal protein L53
MITKFMTEVSTKFNPFSACAKPARLFLSNLPPNARSTGVKISSSLLARNSPEPSSLYVKFKDGKEMNFQCDKYTITGVVDQCDRHSRALQKKADLQD